MNSPSFGGFPEVSRVCLHYSEYFSLNPAAGQLAYYMIRANGVYDPNRTGTGHQPLGYDLWSSVYQHCVVLRSRITVSFVSIETSAVGGLVCGLMPKVPDTPLSLDVNTLIENGRAIYKIIPVRETSYRNGLTLNQEVDVAKWFGVRDIEDNDDLCASVGTNPADEVAHCIFVGPTSAADFAAVQVLIKVLYDVQFMEPKEQTEN